MRNRTARLRGHLNRQSALSSTFADSTAPLAVADHPGRESPRCVDAELAQTESTNRSRSLAGSMSSSVAMEVTEPKCRYQLEGVPTELVGRSSTDESKRMRDSVPRKGDVRPRFKCGTMNHFAKPFGKFTVNE